MEVTPLNIVLLSNWFENPYKDLLIQHLNTKKVYAQEYFRSVFFVQKVLSQGKPDILHLQTLHYFFVSRNKIYCWIKFILFILQLLFMKMIGVKVVWTVHEWIDKISDGQHNISPLQAAIIGKVMTAIITHCDSTKEEMITELKLKNCEKVFVVFHGNYIKAYENNISQLEARKILNIPENDCVFLMFGGIHKGKGTLDGVEAFKKLKQDNIFLIIAGKVSKAEFISSISQAIGDSKNIIFTTPHEGIPDEKIQVYMNACDCVILPYTIFTTSGVAILAMSYSKVCMAPRLGFFKDILDDHGAFLYDPKMEDGLLNAMNLSVEKQKILETMGQHNFKVVQEWSWDYVAAKTYEVYQWCLHHSI
ncbi:glycosyltransferase family 4 protein [Limnoraphis robusta Tam1]|uniref:Glycosyltransferase family 4 protein n=1 Tax=Limnoraphis robusta CCNP1315 TaxID=3110306 RepID=A0ABU5TYF9_9CYAN|nr:glycosyltransferase family 4 protein [Limnoraphis robusta]MEA5497263.1 glycosyltransferase family 4 protein [Limnoraphis robusta BA-68 BA1]MEA5519681.1 glycosyltransferase family 4 protein [Limnoraphis robusta CCNP1315]MEA5540148.1 glycosyltransferase family 4 protein [Limnoraphis robusta Tam1]MEA5544825.1 glycosyltransferase family 4 protein [Limnoraphis robusta CCNP1324]